MLNTVVNNFYTDLHLDGVTRMKQLPPTISLQVYLYNPLIYLVVFIILVKNK